MRTSKLNKWNQRVEFKEIRTYRWLRVEAWKLTHCPKKWFRPTGCNYPWCSLALAITAQDPTAGFGCVHSQAKTLNSYILMPRECNRNKESEVEEFCLCSLCFEWSIALVYIGSQHWISEERVDKFQHIPNNLPW